jgi:hypothetical protein
MLENDPARFAVVGSVLIRESDRVNERAETRSAKRPAAWRHSGTGGRADRITSRPAGSGSGGNKIDRLNHYNYHHR